MPIDFNRYPYYDDFTESNLYYRLLFQPGRAVQARELTQIQSLLQSQIEKLGQHIFKDGALVYGGKINYDKTNTKWLAVKAQDRNGNPVRIRDISPGMIIRKVTDSKSTDNEFQGTILSVIPAEGNDPNTIYFKWTSNSPETEETEGFLGSEILQICDAVKGVERYTVTTLDPDTNGRSIHYGTCSTISVEPGIYFWKGLFVNSPGGSIKLDKYSDITTYRVGYVVSERIDTEDPRSLDPSQHTSNYSAPGADRYKVSLDLTKIGNGLTMDERIVPDFIEVARIDVGNLLTSENGLGRDIYAILGDRLAQRTYDESGNYIVDGFDIKLTNRTTADNPKLVAKMSKGVAYVRGYRHTLNYGNIVGGPDGIDKGRDVLQEDMNILNRYGDNFLAVYDEANTVSTHPENANGMFVVGSGAGQYTSNSWYGNRGEAVSVHCVPQQLVKDYSLADQWKWESTLVGTARPIQMCYDITRTKASIDAGRTGMVYDLWLGDFKSSPISNTTSVTNIIADVSAYANSTFTVFHFDSQTHGITANDRISTSGAIASDWNADFLPIHSTNSTAVIIGGVVTSVASPSSRALTLYRTTGNTSPYKSIVLDTDSSAAWNGSYIGATIKVGNSTPHKIIDYIGTSSSAETKYNTRYGFSKRGMAILDTALEELPKYGDAYTLNLNMKQARSVVYNQNKSSTGAEQYPAILNQAWNVDPISGVTGGDRGLLVDEVYGGRIDGDAIYNRHGESADGEDALLFSTERSAAKSLLTHGSLDGGLTSNTEIIYTEYSSVLCGSTGVGQVFTTPVSGNYKFFGRPKIYPYDSGSSTVSNINQIKENFALVNKTTGKVLTSAITQIVVVNGTSPTLTVTLPAAVQFTAGQEYVLNFPVKAEFAEPAYKKLIKANTTHSLVSTSIPADGVLTDYDNGHVHIAEGDYANTSGTRISLRKPDGFKLHKVVHQFKNNQANTDIANSMLNVIDRFDFDTGQRDMFYDNASIILKPEVDTPTGNLMIIFDRFMRMDNPKGESPSENIDSPGYFSVDSYQYTTDLTLDHSPSQAAFTPGMNVVGNTSGVSAYVMDYANTSGSGAYAKMRVQDVAAPSGVTPSFIVGETIDGFNKGTGALISGKIVSIVEADLKYSEIPDYKSRGKVVYPLRNKLDFRAYVSSNGRVSDTISDSIMPPIPTRSSINAGRISEILSGPASTPMTTSIKLDHFAGRIDKVVLTDSGTYTTIRGNPAVTPFPPRDDQDDKALTLFTLQIPPYTFDPKHVQIKENTARRHTMKDIGRLAKRVENLEYYVSLNALEKAATDLDITFADGTSRFKNGIVVDNFAGFGVADMENLKASLGKGVLRPPVKTYDDYDAPGSIPLLSYAVDDNSDLNRGTRRYYTVDGDLDGIGDVITLDFTEMPLITQPVATTAESVNPFDLQNFTGEIILTPDFDRWMDVEKIPEYNSFLNGVLDNIAGVDENSTATEISDAIKSMDDFWSDIMGTNKLGENIEGTVFYNPDEDLNTQTYAKNIELGSVRDQYLNTATIDAAIAQHGLTDGSTQNIKILPYLRSRDVIVHGEGLKPNHRNAIRFDGISVESYFGQANKIFMVYNPLTDTKFQPSVDGRYEKIKLEGSGAVANAVLISVREPYYRDSQTEGTNRIMVGYIVPEFDAETGKVDYTNRVDGYYGTGWDATKIASGGFQGYSARTITGYNTGATASLTVGGTQHLYNGHYTGSVRNSTGNTTHIELSPDARRYIDGNFRKESTGAATSSMINFTGIPLNSRIQIVSGAGAGQECIANGLIYTTSGGSPVLELKASAAGSTGLTQNIDSTSVYTIGMKQVNPTVHDYGVTQIADITSKTNHYGEKIGVLHIPSTSKVSFTAGRKLVEIMDRFSKEEWLVSSYASAYYFAEGTEREEVEAAHVRLDLLKEIRSKMNLFRISDHPEDLGYVPASNLIDGAEGKLAVCYGIEVANGTWTAKATHDIDYIEGGGEFGTINDTDQERLNTTLTGVWALIRDQYPSIYAKYFERWGALHEEEVAAG